MSAGATSSPLIRARYRVLHQQRVLACHDPHNSSSGVLLRVALCMVHTHGTVRAGGVPLVWGCLWFAQRRPPWLMMMAAATSQGPKFVPMMETTPAVHMLGLCVPFL